MPYVAVALGIVAVGVALWAALTVHGRSPPTPGAEARPYDDSALRQALDHHREVIEAHEERIERLQADYKALVVAVDEGIQDVRRRENRIRASVRRAREELEEFGATSPALEAEASELRELDGEGSEPEGVPPVREDLAERQLVFGAIPGAFSPEEIG